MKPIALYIVYAVIILKSAQRVAEPESFSNGRIVSNMTAI